MSGKTLLDDIARMLQAFEPMPDPFNGATRLVMGAEMFRKLAPVLDACAKDPFRQPSIEIDIRPNVPPSYAVGFRPWRAGDDESARFAGEVVVWFCGPQTEVEKT